jgi:hypothetical protein
MKSNQLARSPGQADGKVTSRLSEAALCLYCIDTFGSRVAKRPDSVFSPSDDEASRNGDSVSSRCLLAWPRSTCDDVNDPCADSRGSRGSRFRGRTSSFRHNQGLCRDGTENCLMNASSARKLKSILFRGAHLTTCIICDSPSAIPCVPERFLLTRRQTLGESVDANFPAHMTARTLWNEQTGLSRKYLVSRGFPFQPKRD